MRGSREPYGAPGFWLGSIPACAGEPLLQAGLRKMPRVHPRVCGGASRVQTTELIQTLQCRLHIMECGMCGQPFYDVKQRLRYATKFRSMRSHWSLSPATQRIYSHEVELRGCGLSRRALWSGRRGRQPGIKSGVGASPSGKAADFDSAMRRFESSRPSQLSYCSYKLSSFSILGSQEGLTLFIRRVDNFRIIFVLVMS